MTKNIHQRIHDAMKEVDYVQKEKKPRMQYSIVTHDAVTALVRPVLHRHGIVYHIAKLRHGQDGNRTRAWVQVAFVNIDNPSDRFLTESFGYGVDDQDKGPGKAISYAVKYALLKTLGLETGDDPDNVQDERANYKAPTITARDANPYHEPGGKSEYASKAAFQLLDSLLVECESVDQVADWFNKRYVKSQEQISFASQNQLKENMFHKAVKVADNAMDLRRFFVKFDHHLVNLATKKPAEIEHIRELLATKLDELTQVNGK